MFPYLAQQTKCTLSLERIQSCLPKFIIGWKMMIQVINILYSSFEKKKKTL